VQTPFAPLLLSEAEEHFIPKTAEKYLILSEIEK